MTIRCDEPAPLRVGIACPFDDIRPPSAPVRIEVDHGRARAWVFANVRDQVIDDFLRPLYGIAWAEPEALPAGVLCAVIPNDGDMPWVVEGPILGDIASLDLGGPAWLDIALVEMSTGAVAAVRSCALPQGLAERIKEALPRAKHQSRAYVESRFQTLENIKWTAWEKGARWVAVDEGFEGANRAARLLDDRMALAAA